MAGAGGIEPPNGGIKIRCLTAWLRPNWADWERHGPATGELPRPRRSIGGDRAIQPGFAKATPRRSPASLTASVRRRTSARQEATPGAATRFAPAPDRLCGPL